MSNLEYIFYIEIRLGQVWKPSLLYDINKNENIQILMAHFNNVLAIPKKRKYDEVDETDLLVFW